MTCEERREESDAGKVGAGCTVVAARGRDLGVDIATELDSMVMIGVT